MSKASLELWAVLDEDDRVVWTRGGSSTSQRLMVFDSESKALACIKNKWTQQVHDKNKLRVSKIYSVFDQRYSQLK